MQLGFGKKNGLVRAAASVVTMEGADAATAVSAFRKTWSFLFMAVFIFLQAPAQSLLYRDLQGSWDTTTVLSNPHKGWYIHYYDNGLDRYGASLAPNDFVQDLKGLNHVYLRLAWSYLEPNEGDFNWPVIDSILEKWTAKGFRITFRITCKETDSAQVFATPRWVKEAGAQGAYAGRNKNWEPDFGDPVFLEKLENFHRAFGARYNRHPFLEYVDIGSIGDWGEGHTVFGTGREYSFEVIKKHIDIYRRCYPGTLLFISDDIITSRRNPADAEAAKILAYILEQGIAFRDDSVSVKYFADHYGFSTLRSQALFGATWRRLPADLELEHYLNTLEFDTWKEGRPLEAAISEARATYVGFHGPPRKWLNDNPGYPEKLTNKIGYWFFIKGVRHAEEVTAGEKMELSVSWLNRGVAPAYHRYHTTVEIACGGKTYAVRLPGSDNRRWMPDSLFIETYSVTLPTDLPNGAATVSIRLEDSSAAGKRPVALGLNWKNRNGFYNIGKLNVKAAGPSGKKKVVLFGDSITQGAFEPTGYATLLNQLPGISSRYELIGQGIGGNRSTDLQKRLEKDVLSYAPSEVVIFVGVNDCGWHRWHPSDPQVSQPQYEAALTAMVKRLQAKNIGVILCTPAVIGDNQLQRDVLDARLETYAAACRRVAKKRGCALVDVRKAFVDYLRAYNPTDQRKGIVTTDGVHPSITGSRLIADALQKHFTD